MKLNWKILYTGFAAAILLTACGNAEDTSNDSTAPDSSIEVNGDADENTTNQGASGSQTESKEDASDNASNPSNDGMENAVRTESDAQNYSIELLPGFTLTSEEPGRDSLYSDEKPAAFMRIETKELADASYDYLLDNMKETLKASSDGQEPAESTDKYVGSESIGMQNVKAFTVDTETGPVTGVLYEKDEMLVRLTIFDTSDEEFKLNFWNMGKTIK